MSRIGEKPVIIPNNVKVSIEGNVIFAQSELGKEEYAYPNFIKCSKDEQKIYIELVNKNSKMIKFWGLHRSNIANLIKGLSESFSVILEINGVGYKASTNNGYLSIFLGYSHEIIFIIPSGINVDIQENSINIKGVNKQLVGFVAAKIRSLRLPEPYKGKGVKLKDEIILRKESKK